MAQINSGLGWTCDSSFYTASTSTEIGRDRYDYSFYKTAEGGAIAAKIISSNTYDCFAVMSTVQSFAALTNSGYTVSRTVTVDGTAWYVTIPYYGSEDPTDFPCANPDNPVGDISTDEDFAEIAAMILEAADVQYVADNRIPTVNYVQGFIKGVEAETASRVSATNTKLSKVETNTANLYDDGGTNGDLVIYEDELYEDISEPGMIHGGSFNLNDYTKTNVETQLKKAQYNITSGWFNGANAYSAGDTVMVYNRLYRFKTDHAAYTAWNNNEVELISVCDMIDETAQKVADIAANLGIYGADVYGFHIDYTNYTYTRIAGAVGKTAGADFDNLNPWKLRGCNLADDGTVNAYYGDNDYVEDGSNGQVMTEVNKYFYRRVPIRLDPIAGTVGGYHIREENIYISPTRYVGFKTDPFHILPDGTEIDKAYFSTYEGSIYDVSESSYLLNDEQVADFTATTGDKLCSIAGAKPCSGLTQNLTRANAEQLAANRGAGWHGMTSKALASIQMLFMVEYATLNSQSAIAKGVVDKASGTGNEAEITGATASLGNASGMADGTDGLVSWRYRSIENLSGNIWKFMHDVNVIGDGTKRGGEIFICNDYDYHDFPRITSNSVDIVAEEGDGITVSISEIAQSPTYQWQYKTSPEDSNWVNFTKSTSATLGKTMTSAWDGWQVSCKITDAKGNIIRSGIITLTLSSENKNLTGSVGGISEYTINPDYYKSVGFTLPNSNNYVSAFGYNPEADNDWVFIPSDVGDGASSNYPVGDYATVTNNLTDSRLMQIGGSWNESSKSGTYDTKSSNGLTLNSRSGGCRLIYQPGS